MRDGTVQGERVAGKALNLEIAERVMGWEWCNVRLRGSTNTVRVLLGPGGGYWRQDGAHDERDFARVSLRSYSTEIAAAWGVFTHQRFLDQGWEPFIESGRGLDGEVVWEVGFAHHALDACIEYVHAPADIPGAICRQALAALDATPGQTPPNEGSEG
jgi:hypothetical protein